MNIKTITTVDGVNVVDFGAAASRFYWVENLGSTTVYVSGQENIVPDGDNVKVLYAGCGTMVENFSGGKIYILGAGKFQITNQGDKFPPFRNAPVADGGVQAEGNPVIMDGLQGGVPFSEMVVSGKNLLKYPYYTTTKTINGVTFTDNGDGTITANGTATAMTSFALIWKNIRLPKGTYTISGCPEGGDTITGFYIVCGTDSIRFSTDVGNGGTFSIIDDTNDFTFSLRINSGVTVDNIVFRPQLELGTAPTAYEPPITGRDLTVNVSGKNLLPAMSNSVTRNGITYTVNADGTITLNGTAEKADGVDVVYKMPLKAGVYTLSGCPEGGSGITFALRAGLGTANTLYGRDYGNGLKITADTDTVLTVTIQNAEVGRVFDNVVFRPQLEYGTEATEYEPYSGSTTTITPDSNPYVIPTDIIQQDGLNNISVSNGKISVVGVRKNAALKKIWDEIGNVNAVLETVTGGV